MRLMSDMTGVLQVRSGMAWYSVRVPRLCVAQQVRDWHCRPASPPLVSAA